MKQASPAKPDASVIGKAFALCLGRRKERSAAVTSTDINGNECELLSLQAAQAAWDKRH